MLRAIDHLVIVVPELDAAIGSYRGLGFTVTPGGRHPIGTHNALIGLTDGSYVELIAFFEPNAQHRWHRRLQQGGGLIDFCVQTGDRGGDVAAFRDAGVKIAEPCRSAACDRMAIRCAGMSGARAKICACPLSIAGVSSADSDLSRLNP